MKNFIRTYSMFNLRMWLVVGLLLGPSGLGSTQTALGATAGPCQRFLGISAIHSAVKGVSVPSVANCPPVTLPGRSNARPSALALSPGVRIQHDYSALQPDLYTPPDPQGAAGPNSYIETVNQTIALFGSKLTGTAPITATFDSFFNTLARVDINATRSSPVVAYNNLTGRFIVGDQDIDYGPAQHVSNFDIAISKTSNPATLSAADWNFYPISTTETNYDADYPGNIGYNADGYVITLNMFPVISGTTKVQVVSVLNNGTSFKNDLAGFSVRPTVMQDAAPGDPMWLVTEQDGSSLIDVIRMTNLFSNFANFSHTSLAVTPYIGSALAPARNPDGTLVTDNIDSRILKAAEWNGTLVATHNVAISTTEDVAQWYAINIGSGTPILMDQGRLSGGDHTYIIYPAIDINASGQIGMTYMQVGDDSSTDYLSMYVTGRNATDPAGTMLRGTLVPAGAGQANYSAADRAGDMSGINVDPVDGSFWAANEFATSASNFNWGTAVANFILNDFGLQRSPTHLSIAQGSSGAATISTTVAAGAPGPITLGASLAPAGPTTSLSPTSVTPGSSATLTVTVALTVATGIYTATVTGVDGAINHTTSITVTVTPQQFIVFAPFITNAAIPALARASNSVTAVDANNRPGPLSLPCTPPFGSTLAIPKTIVYCSGRGP